MRPAASSTAIAVLAAVLALTGCGTDSVESTGSPAGSTTDPAGQLSGPGAEVGEGGQDSDVGDDSEWEDADDPLIAFLGFDPATEPDVVAAHDAAEQARADCMAEAGFEYVPRPFRAGPGPVNTRLTESSTRDWVEEWGFGISTRFYNTIEVGPDLTGRAAPAIPSGGEPEPEDPNTATAFSPADEDCFITSLRDGFDGLPDEGPTAELLALTEDLGGEVSLGHPLIVEHEHAVAVCMADAGYNYSRLYLALERFNSEVLAIDATLSGSPERVDLTEGELAALGDQLLPDDILAQVADVQKREIEFAVAAWDCGSSEAAHWGLVEEILRDEKREFVESHREELEPYRRDA